MNGIDQNNETKDRIKPKTSLDAVAEKLILCSNGLLSQIPREVWNEITNKDQPYLSLLEIVLGINHRFNEQKNIVGQKRKGNPSSKSNGETNPKKSTDQLLTCTPAISSTYHQATRNAAQFESHTKYQTSNQVESPMQEFWTPSMDIEMTHTYEDTLPSFEDLAPFDHEFYLAFGELLTVAFQAVGKYDFASHQISSNGREHDDYSLYLSVDAVRVVHIMSEMMDLNLLGDFKDRYQMVPNTTLLMSTDSISSEMDEDGQSDITFMDLLLYHVEGSTHVQESNIQYSEETIRKIPMISSLFRHFSVLPQLEGHVHHMTRLYRAHGSVHATDRISTSLKIEHMKKTELFQERLETELRRHIDTLEYIVGSVYERSDANLRKKARIKMGSLLHTFVLTHGTGAGSKMGGASARGVENSGAAGVDSMLKIILRILRGITIRDAYSDGTFRLPEPYLRLLDDVLLPLHKPSGFVLWRDQFPLLGLYHKTLVQCIGALVSLDNYLICKVIKHIIHPDIWPLEGKRDEANSTQLANTPKLVLLLHEIDTYVGLLDLDSETSSSHLTDLVVPLVIRLSSCIASDNSRSSERALEFFKNKKFKCLVRRNLERVITPLLRALCRIQSGMDVPWNPTVRKMTLLVLRELESYDKDFFEKTCDDILTAEAAMSINKSNIKENIVANKAAASSLVQRHDESISNNMMSLKSSMGSWRPPSSSLKVSEVPQINSSISMPPPMPRKPQNKLSTSGAQPPLTVTGVAPWAIKGQENGKIIPSAIPRRSHLPVKTMKTDERIEANFVEEMLSEGTVRIRSYIEKLKPPSSDDDDESDDGISSWAKAQMSESPALLPNLRFHDLVFGQVLGTGAFSTVTYARQIIKGKTRSHWPEYAVKLVSTQRIEELGYEKSINREVAILRLMVHPSIARLVSSFRFKDGAYLILEYASGGDLHSLLKRSGSLDDDSTRFLVGEMVAVLNYIHDLDFVYADLKPENILITETGHIKLTDFGGCRPLSEIAREKVRCAGHNILKTLRDGDWRNNETEYMSIENKHPTDEGSENNDIEQMDEDDDVRIEGTTAYLPPEVVLGNIPTKAADSWALGCVLFQCLAGRPPLLASCDLSTRQKIVTFNLSSENDDDFFLESTGTQAFSAISKELIARLLNKDPNERPGMSTVAVDEFFNGVDVYSLHRKPAHCLDAGNMAPTPDADWSRRQFSSIWAPQPQAYVIQNANHLSMSSFIEKQNAPIVEGDEHDGPFLPSGKRVNLIGILER
jgi:serine/threonine protein kinase